MHNDILCLPSHHVNMRKDIWNIWHCKRPHTRGDAEQSEILIKCTSLLWSREEFWLLWKKPLKGEREESYHPSWHVKSKQHNVILSAVIGGDVSRWCNVNFFLLLKMTQVNVINNMLRCAMENLKSSFNLIPSGVRWHVFQYKPFDVFVSIYPFSIPSTRC